MATLKQIQEKQKSIKSINKITKAMQLVSSAKSQKAIKQRNEYQDYFDKVKNIVSMVAGDVVDTTERERTYWILYMSDLGLAGGYNSSLLIEMRANWKHGDRALVIGNKGFSFARRHKDSVEWFSLEEITSGNEISEIITRIKKAYYDEGMTVKTIHTTFLSQMEFKPLVSTLLPIQPIEKTEEDNSIFEFEIEKEELLHQVEAIYIQSFLIGVHRDAQASEHTSRRMAMEAASKNGEELMEKLSIEFNRGRQAKITQEISEIIAGAESLK